MILFTVQESVTVIGQLARYLYFTASVFLCAMALTLTLNKSLSISYETSFRRQLLTRAYKFDIAIEDMIIPERAHTPKKDTIHP